jgi:hypothetical protein
MGQRRLLAQQVEQRGLDDRAQVQRDRAVRDAVGDAVRVDLQPLQQLVVADEGGQ